MLVSLSVELKDGHVQTLWLLYFIASGLSLRKTSALKGFTGHAGLGIARLGTTG